MSLDPTQRFTSRVDNYVKFRPSYPREVMTILADECGLTPAWRLADIGSGTGILTEMFLKNGNAVFAVEPNRAMRAAAETMLKDYPNFKSIDGTAEATTLAEASVELVAAGQAFHWFDPPRARREFARILRPGGWTALIWNERRTRGTAFLEAYEALLHEYAGDYAQKNIQNHIDEEILRDFFDARGYRERRVGNFQEFDFEGLKGRTLSSSYAPEPGDEKHEPLMDALRKTFERHQRAGCVRFDYDTRVFVGRVG